MEGGEKLVEISGLDGGGNAAAAAGCTCGGCTATATRAVGAALRTSGAASGLSGCCAASLAGALQAD